MTRFSYVWEYEVRAESVPEFLRHYAPDGTWARLFRRASGYLGTDLYRDRRRSERYCTVDHWIDEAAYREFRRAFAAEFEALDQTSTEPWGRDGACRRTLATSSPQRKSGPARSNASCRFFGFAA